MRAPIHLSDSDVFIGEDILNLTHPHDPAIEYRVRTMEIWLVKLRAGMNSLVGSFKDADQANVQEFERVAGIFDRIDTALLKVDRQLEAIQSEQQADAAYRQVAFNQIHQKVLDLLAQAAQQANQRASDYEQQLRMAGEAHRLIANSLEERIRALENTNWRRFVRWIQQRRTT